MKTKLETAKRVIEENYKNADCGIFDCRNWTGDPMVTVYDETGLMIDICYYYSYFEVFGLSDEDFAELKEFYNRLVSGKQRRASDGTRKSQDQSRDGRL